MKVPTVSAKNDCASFDIEECDDMDGIIRSLIDGKHPGILATVDSLGRPRARWMGTLAFHEFPHIYTLTAPDSRKIRQIAEHPLVSWMFSNSDLTIILHLTGRASVVADPAQIRKVWNEIEDKSHAYFLDNFKDRKGCAVLETEIEHVECTLPKSCLRWSVQMNELIRAKA